MSSSKTSEERFSAFLGPRQIANGSLAEVTRAAAKAVRSRMGHAPLLVFADSDGRLVDLDLRGTPDEAAARAATPPAVPAPSAAHTPPRGRGRPTLGVVAREVTLLPRHWEWLALQPGGASVTLRRLVDEARRTHGAQDAVRAAQERCFRFMNAIAGNLPLFEEALRALYARNAEGFDTATKKWPTDIRVHAHALAARVFDTR